jgi:nicotinate phosphoribosyltransferase
VEAGFRYGVPLFGTAAHSWVLAFAGEKASFRVLQKLLGPLTAYLIDTYDTIHGARLATSLGRPMWGVRLDSGDMVQLSRDVRKIFDDAGFKEAKIMASGDLNEEKIRAIVQSGAPVDAFGVGTELSTSADAPNLSAVYKMVEIEVEGIKRYTAKQSADKHTMPSAKQVFRYAHRDLVSCSWECPTCPDGAESAVALLQPVVIDGSLIEPLPDLKASREHCAQSLKSIQPGHIVEYSPELLKLAARGRRG